MIDIERKKSYDIRDLLGIMEMLRSPDGCPWDREQNHHSVRNNFIEETYEAVEAIDNDDPVLLKEELGDVLLQIVFHCRMEQEKGSFSFDDVADGICKKLIERHPHVFGNVSVDGTKDVLENWDKIKQKTKNQKTGFDTLRAVPSVYPALMRAQKLQSRASKAGMDFEDRGGALQKLNEEMDELCLAICEDKPDNITEEIGDLLFSAVNVARLSGVDAEEALGLSAEKFVKRFEYCEKAAAESGTDIKKATSEQLDEFWKAAKTSQKIKK